jgi:arginine/serine-rich splicing factor 7
MPRNYRSRSRSKSRTRSRTRSGSRLRSYRGGRGNYRRDENYDNEPTDSDMCRLHLADLTENVSKGDVEKAFSKFGELEEVWIAKNPPCFAFVVFKNKDDAAEALKEMNGRTLGSRRIRVSQALPRTRGRNKRYDSDTRCYQCGRVGHFSRDCRYESDSRKRSRYSRYHSSGLALNKIQSEAIRS